LKYGRDLQLAHAARRCALNVLGSLRAFITGGAS
jgi:hypothetical protein